MEIHLIIDYQGHFHLKLKKKHYRTRRLLIMKNEAVLTKEQRIYIDNLKLIMEHRNITQKQLDDEIPEVHASNISNAFKHKRPISESNCEYIAEYLGESLEDMKTEGYATKKYYSPASLDMIEFLRKSPYSTAMMLLVAYYAIACIICSVLATYREISPLYVFFSVSLTWLIVTFGNSMRKVTESEIRLSLVRKFVELVDRRKCAAIVIFSVLEMFCCTKTYYETFMIPALTMLLLEVSGAFSKKSMKQYKAENMNGYLGTLILVRLMEFVAFVAYVSSIYNVFVGK